MVTWTTSPAERRPVSASRPLLALLDLRLLLHATFWTVVSGLAFGLVTAIIPNPVFGRQIPPEAFAIGVWLVSAPLMGIVMATYTAPVAASPIRLVPLGPGEAAAAQGRSTTLGSLAGFGAFLAIGCPVCNKIALLLLGTSGALSIYAPIQPIIGAVSLALLVTTAAWRLRLRATGNACPA
jgi:hypothetical protein